MGASVLESKPAVERQRCKASSSNCIETEISKDSTMSKSLDPLKITAQELHRFWFSITTEKQWYDIMRECRQWFGKNWRGQAKVRRKFNTRGGISFRTGPLSVWFEVPDPRFATWVSVKMAIQVQSDAKFNSIKNSA